MVYHTPPKDRPFFKSFYVCDSTDRRYDTFWFLTEEAHQWFVENNVSYELFYELSDWWITVPDDKAVYAKLAMGE
jgi:hypothetical protein